MVMAKFQRIHDKIFIFTKPNNDKIIYKVSVFDENVKSIKQEYALIRHMALIDNIFNTFDNYLEQDIIAEHILLPVDTVNYSYHMAKLFKSHTIRFENNKFSLMYTNFNPKLVTLYDYFKIYNNDVTKNVLKVLDIVHNVFHSNNFIHGDFKLDNIMIHITNYSFKIIDLDFSLICSNIKKITDDDDICLYLGKNITVNKRYLQLFDIYIFCASLVACYDYLSANVLKNIKKYFTKNATINETILDFTVIYIRLHSLGKSKITTAKNAIIGTFDFINKIFLNTLNYNFNTKCNEHTIKIQNIIMENIALNTNSDNSNDLLNIDDSTIHSEKSSDSLVID